MKIVIMSLYHPDITPGGAQQVAYDLFRALEKMSGVDAIFVASVGDSPSAEALRRPGASITGFEGRLNEYLWWNDGMDPWYFSHRDPSPLFDLLDWLAFVDPDIVSLHHFFRIGSEMPSLVRKWTHARTVFTLHEYLAVCAADGHLKRLTDGSICSGSSPFRCHECLPQLSPEHFFRRNRWIADNLAAVDHFVAPSISAVLALQRSSFPFPITVIANGSDNPREIVMTDTSLAEDPIESAGWGVGSEIVFGFFGQLLDDKGLAVLLDAVEILRRQVARGWRVEIHGGNLEFASQQLRDRIQGVQQQTGGAVAVKGKYANSDVVRLMAECDWLVIPALWEETFSMVLSEARLARRPVIASNLGALRERVNDGVDGLLVEPNSPRSLAAAMRRALHREDWRRMALATPSIPSAQEMAANYLNLFEDIICALSKHSVKLPSSDGELASPTD